SISMRECVDAVLTIQQHRLGERIRVETKIDDTDTVECYPSLIGQAIMNLVSNSIDAIVGEGSIVLVAGIQGGDYEIVVEAGGSRNPPELRERVVEPFFTTRPVGTGTGLGLAITYSIVQKHGGSLELLHAPRRGTRAVISFP